MSGKHVIHKPRAGEGLLYDQPKVTILGVPLSRLNFEESFIRIVHHVRNRRAGRAASLMHVVTANAEIVVEAQNNSRLMSVLQRADLVTPDGIGVVLASRFIGLPIPERVTGFDLLVRLLSQAEREKWRVFFLGARPDVIQAARTRALRHWPELSVAVHHGFFGPEDDERIVAMINAYGPDLLFVGMGSPQQDLWIDRYRSRLQVGVAMGVGGCFDVLAGRVKRAPQIWQRVGLEWLYRVIRQPSRWRRVMRLPRFVFGVLVAGQRPLNERMGVEGDVHQASLTPPMASGHNSFREERTVRSVAHDV